MDTDRLLAELIASGLFSESEAQALIAKKGAREFGAMAIKAVTDLSPWDVREVTIKTEAWTISWSQGQMTVTPVRPKSRPIGNTGQAVSNAVVDGIPSEVWKLAAERLGVKFFGAKAAARSGRIRALAIQIAKERGLIA